MNRKQAIVLATVAIFVAVLGWAFFHAIVNEPPEETGCLIVPEEVKEKCYNPYSNKDFFLAYDCAKAACESIHEEVAEEPPCVFSMTLKCGGGQMLIPDIPECEVFKANKKIILECVTGEMQ